MPRSCRSEWILQLATTSSGRSIYCSGKPSRNLPGKIQISLRDKEPIMSSKSCSQIIFSRTVDALIFFLVVLRASKIVYGGVNNLKLSRRGLSQFEEKPFEVDLMHIYHENAPNVLPNLTLSKRIQLSVENDKERRIFFLHMRELYQKNNTFGMEHLPAASVLELRIPRIRFRYLVHFGLGENAAPQEVYMDTASQLTWVTCLPCDPCPNEPQVKHHNHFDPSTSDSYRNVRFDSDECIHFTLEGKTGKSSDGKDACTYSLLYGSSNKRTAATGVLAYDKFTFKFGPSQVEEYEDIIFGCTHSTESPLLSDTDGIMGLSRGPLSTMSQLKLDSFSHCLVDFRLHPIKKGKLTFGKRRLNYQFVPLAPPAMTFTTGYYIDLKSILVDDVPISFPRGYIPMDPAVDERRVDVLIDSGSEFSSLHKSIYDPLKAALGEKITYPVLAEETPGDGGFKLCYNIAGLNKPEFPNVAFQFGDTILRLPQNNVFMQTVIDRITCLIIEREEQHYNIMGATALQNIEVLYDMAENQMGFAHRHC